MTGWMESLERRGIVLSQERNADFRQAERKSERGGGEYVCEMFDGGEDGR